MGETSLSVWDESGVDRLAVDRGVLVYKKSSYFKKVPNAVNFTNGAW